MAINREAIQRLHKIKEGANIWSDIQRIQQLAGVDSRTSGRVLEHLRVERMVTIHGR